MFRIKDITLFNYSHIDNTCVVSLSVVVLDKTLNVLICSYKALQVLDTYLQ